MAGTIFGIRIRDQTPRPSYKPQYQPNLLDSLQGLKAGALRTGANALRFKVSKKEAKHYFKTHMKLLFVG